MARKKIANGKAQTNLRMKSLSADKARGVRGGGGEPNIKIKLTETYISSYEPHGTVDADLKIK
jgi:hypothetical protein